MSSDENNNGISKEALDAFEGEAFTNWKLGLYTDSVSFCGNEALILIEEIRRLRGWEHIPAWKRLQEKHR